ncbi:MAG TPA: hypothetical protein VFT36_09645 [Methylomirabilota bacterium]|nr:hypothetical protein [Methylomirabilota bacterium]
MAQGLLPARVVMTPSVVTLQEVLRHHRTLSRRGREFYESLLEHGDVLAVRVDYLPGAMLWLVTTPKQAQLMRKAREGRSTSDVCVMSLSEAQDLFATTGDPHPTTLYEVAGWLLAPAPDEIPPAPQEEQEPEDPDSL